MATGHRLRCHKLVTFMFILLNSQYAAAPTEGSISHHYRESVVGKAF